MAARSGDNGPRDARMSSRTKKHIDWSGPARSIQHGLPGYLGEQVTARAPVSQTQEDRHSCLSSTRAASASARLTPRPRRQTGMSVLRRFLSP
jgi:hypothetical protein